MPGHRRLFRRLFEMLATAGVLEASGDGFVVKIGPDDALPDGMPLDAEAFADEMRERYWHGATEVGLTQRCGGALADVLNGRADGLTLLFSSGQPSAADLYLQAPMARAANGMLGETIAALLARRPDDRRLRVLEIGAGTGSATASVLPQLPDAGFDYVYSDISAGFFSEAEERFADSRGSIEYRVLDIEKDPVAQGFDLHGYDLLVASNVLHATRDLSQTLAHCRKLLAPCGQLAALENLRGQSWLDMTFGQLDGWWRFADGYRSRHPLADPATWRQALADAGFREIEILGPEPATSNRVPDRGVVLAQGPAEVEEAAGTWLLTGDRHGVAEALAAGLAARNQTVVLAGRETTVGGEPETGAPGVIAASIDAQDRDAWRSMLEGLPSDAPLRGVVHLAALDGHGAAATAAELGEDARQAGGSALALLQGLVEADAAPENGVWFITRGGQVLERERQGQLSGAMLWGLGKVVALEAPHLQPRMIDLDPGSAAPLADLVNELMYPDAETHLAFRSGRRQAARLVRAAPGERGAAGIARRHALVPATGPRRHPRRAAGV